MQHFSYSSNPSLTNYVNEGLLKGVFNTDSAYEIIYSVSHFVESYFEVSPFLVSVGVSPNASR